MTNRYSLSSHSRSTSRGNFQRIKWNCDQVATNFILNFRCPSDMIDACDVFRPSRVNIMGSNYLNPHGRIRPTHWNNLKIFQYECAVRLIRIFIIENRRPKYDDQPFASWASKRSSAIIDNDVARSRIISLCTSGQSEEEKKSKTTVYSEDRPPLISWESRNPHVSCAGYTRWYWYRSRRLAADLLARS